MWHAVNEEAKRASFPLTVAPAVLTILVVIGLARVATVWRQAQLDYALSESVSRRDFAEVQRLLQIGANPEAPWSGYGWDEFAYRLFTPTAKTRGLSIRDWVVAVNPDLQMSVTIRTARTRKSP